MVGAGQTVLSAFPIGIVSTVIVSTLGTATVFQDFLDPPAMTLKTQTEIGEDGANGLLAQEPALEAAPEKGSGFATTPHQLATESIAH